MMRTRVAVSVLGVLLATSVLQGQTDGHYRDFQLGGDIASVSASAGLKASDAKTVHAHPAMIQSLEWERPFSLSDEKLVDPVQRITFSFYNDQLYRLVVEYDRARTEGLTDADLIEAISTMYGPPVPTTARPARALVPTTDTESGTKVAGWGTDAYTAVLYRAPYGSGMRLVVTSVRLNTLARTAEAQAVRLDERDAPQRERARQKKEADDERAAKAKARLVNKATFRP